MRRFLHQTLALCLALTMGGHWALLQTAAWCGMAVSYSRQAPLRLALERTFDGQHPCSLCLVVRKGRAEEKRLPAAAPTVKVEAPALPASVDAPPAPEAPRAVFAPCPLADGRTERPALPPPRLLPA